MADPQTWVWPPIGPADPPISSTANFGPVHMGDLIRLDWSAQTAPDVVWSCFSQSKLQTGYIVVRNTRPPVSYRFAQTANQANTNDLIFCHFYFTNTTNGNSVTFEYDNTPRQNAVVYASNGAVTASGSGSTSTTSSSSSSSTGSSSTASSAGSASRSSATSTSTSPTSTASSSNSSSNSSSGGGSGGGGGLSAGAGAGIGVGVALAVIGALALAFFLYKRRKRTQTHPVSEMDGQPMAQNNTYGAGAAGAAGVQQPKGSVYEKEAPPAELEHTESPYNRRSELP